MPPFKIVAKNLSDRQLQKKSQKIADFWWYNTISLMIGVSQVIGFAAAALLYLALAQLIPECLELAEEIPGQQGHAMPCHAI